MARLPRIRDEDYRRLVDEAEAKVRTIAGTIAPDDEPIVGQAGFVQVAFELQLTKSRAYASVSTAIAQPWILSVGDQPATMTSSLTNFLLLGRHALAANHRASLRQNFIEWGRQGGRPRNSVR